MSVSALAASRLASPSVSGVGAARPLYYKNLSNAGIAALTASQIGAMQSVEMAALSGSQIKAFNPVALASGLSTYLNNKQVLTANFIGNLSNNQISQFGAPLVQALGTAFAKALTTAQIKGLDANHVQYLSAAQVASLSKAQLGALNGNQIKAIDNEDIRAMTTSQFSTLSMMQLQALTVGQIGQVDAFQIRAISAKNFASLYTDQVAAFTTKAVANLGGTQIAAMTKEQISHGLDPAKIGALSASRMRYFNPSQISALTNPEVAAISLSTMKTLYDPHLRAFTVDQLSHLSEDKIDWLINKKLQITGFTVLQKDAILTRKATFSNAAPTVAHAITDKSATEDVAFTFTVPSNTFADSDSGDTLSYAATRANGSALPSWLQFNANTRTFSGTPGSADPGVLNLKVTVTDRVGASVSSAFKVTVAASNAVLTKQWTKLLGSVVNDNANALTTGLDGSIYVSGYTTGALDGQTSSGGGDAFLTKYSADGTKAWTKLLGSSGYDNPNALTVGLDGSIYVSGYTEAALDGQTNSGGYDAFLTKYSADGTKVWTKLLGSSSWEVSNALTTGVDGSIYVSGYTDGALDGEISSGSRDAFLTKYSADGTKAWTKLLGSGNDDMSNALTTGIDGSIYVSGQANGALDGQTYSGGGDAFLTKYSADGTKAWTKLLGTSSNDFATALTTGLDGSIYVSGFTDGALDCQTKPGGVGDYDAFLTKYSADGTKAWTKLLGTIGYDYASALTTGLDGSIYVSGYTGGATLDGQTSSGGGDAFLTKYSV